MRCEVGTQLAAAAERASLDQPVACPDCGAQWLPETGEPCPGCGLNWDDVAAGADFYNNLEPGVL